MKGIILAGGTGTRLYPLTQGTSKQLIPLYNKPMIYYPLSTLMLAGVRDILIITTPHERNSFERLLGDGSKLGCKFSYAMQEKPEGLAQAFVIGEKFIGRDDVVLILGDNFFYSSGLRKLFERCRKPKGGIIFAHHVADTTGYGVVEFDKKGKAISVEEKPKKPKSNYAVPGLYFFDNAAVSHAKRAKQSARGEYEITEVIQAYLKAGKLKVIELDRGTVWLDTGTFASLMEAAEFVRVIENRQGFLIGSIEEVAYRMRYITKEQLKNIATPLLKSGYGSYLMRIVDEPYVPR
ncbi:glucose-1-phosphate thymidylyltransferase RfbA [Candidatus Kaiserbacteria bacterium]|nr:glucose-1-phosphate thymidylyltransferase RfbA [Candidatus Kaiserbacteria bacterium]